MGVRIRTTMRPHEQIEVDRSEFVDLARQGLLADVEVDEGEPVEPKTSEAPKAGTPSVTDK